MVVLSGELQVWSWLSVPRDCGGQVSTWPGRILSAQRQLPGAEAHERDLLYGGVPGATAAKVTTPSSANAAKIPALKRPSEERL